MNIQLRVVVPNAAAEFWFVKVAHLIEDFGVIFKGLKAMSETDRNVEHLTVFGGELTRNPFSKSWRSRTDVNEDIENRSAYAPNDLRFGAWGYRIVEGSNRTSLQVI